jgi:hypothetical protein
MTNSKVRRSGRISREIPILLIGCNPEGMVFSETTKTVMLSRHGAGIVSVHSLIAEQELSLRSLESNRETEIRVVGEIGSQDEINTYGVAFVDPVLDFWELQFPPPVTNEKEAPVFSLECSGCGESVNMEQGDFEADVCAIHGGLVRYCGECGLSTMWKRGEARFAPPKRTVSTLKNRQADASVAVLEPPAKEAIQPNTKTTGAIANRRDRVRAKVNFFACVRTDGFGDDIVHCIDMSRGGLSFKTHHPYAEGSVVRIAVPFSPESRNAPAIFVPAKIVYSREIPTQKIFRCGVAYLPTSESYSQR